MENHIAFEISRLLLEHSIKPNCMGYYYLRDCILFGIQESGAVVLKKDLYIRLSEKYGKSAASVEKAITACIEKSFLSIDVQARYCDLIQYRGYKLSNKAFMMQLIERLKLPDTHSAQLTRNTR